VTDQRGDVVVRVRSIEEDRAAVTAARARAAADEAALAASRAAERASVHPLQGRSRALAPGELMTAVGVASALREAALATQRRLELAHQAFEEARAEVATATSRRRAAERLVERRVAEIEAAEARRVQRQLDESGHRPRTAP
jgi:multidrug efflux pump subunit AcrA (membrane-fusion protein)